MSLKLILAFLLAAFFAVGAAVNLLALGGAEQDYARWGYPRGFHFISGTLELLTALLLLRRRTRRWGAVLGAVIMASAGATVVLNGETGRVFAPAVVLVLCVVTALLYGGARAVEAIRDEPRP
ncbi:hypothetical protein BRI6_4547 [plant metagenome]|uniref:DoxX family protein n=1 Tax=plant metagenome TaxID=1297885 RepID=A0A484RVJ0_9ZZZZ